MFGLSMMQKRRIATVVFAVLALAAAPLTGDWIKGIMNYDIYGGFLLRHAFGILGIIGAWMLWKKHY